MDQEWVKEDGVALLHVQVDPLPVLHAADAVVHLVDSALPVRVVVLQEVVLKSGEGLLRLISHRNFWCKKSLNIKNEN